MLKRLCVVGGFLATAAVYTSAALAQSFPIFKVADTSTQIPGAPPGQTFTSFDAPVASRNSDALGPETPNIAFRALGPNGLIGVYNASPTFPITNPTFTPFRVADTTTFIPAPVPQSTFSDFSRPSLTAGFGGSFVIFTGSALSGSQQVYRADSRGGGLSVFGTGGQTRATAPSAMSNFAAFGQGDTDDLMTLIVRDSAQIIPADVAKLGPPSVSHFGFDQPGNQTRVAYAAGDDPARLVNEIRLYRPELPILQVQTIARFTTPIPGGTGSFTGFGDPAASRDGALFRGSGAGGQQGIYEYRIGPTSSTLFPIVDRTTPVPGRPGVTFTSFSDPAVYNGYMFEGILSDGNEALYAPLFIPGGPSGLTELISTGDIINGKVIDALEISRESIGGALNADYAFKATFTDGSQGIYVLKLPEPGAMTVSVAAIALLATRRRTPSVPNDC